MKVKISNLSRRILSVLLLIVAAPAIIVIYSDGDLINIAFHFLIAVAIFSIAISLISTMFLPKRDHTLYSWMDKVVDEDEFLRNTFSQNRHRDLMRNLEVIFETILSVTNYDKVKLKLLKGYYQSLYVDGPKDYFYKTIMTIFSTLIIWGFGKGVVWNFFSLDNKGDMRLTIINLIFFIMVLMISLAIFGIQTFNGKRRQKLMIEIIDVCIEKLTSEKTKVEIVKEKANV